VTWDNRVEASGKRIEPVRLVLARPDVASGGGPAPEVRRNCFKLPAELTPSRCAPRDEAFFGPTLRRTPNLKQAQNATNGTNLPRDE
jgi:hypothetical protein